MLSPSSERCRFDFADDDAESVPIYLDAAGKTPLLKDAANMGREVVGLKSRPWQIAKFGLSNMESEIRDMFSSLLSVPSIDIAIGPR